MSRGSHADPQDYKHFGAFIRRAPSAQHHAAWKTLGQEIEKRLEQNPQDGPGGLFAFRVTGVSQAEGVQV